MFLGACLLSCGNLSTTMRLEGRSLNSFVIVASKYRVVVIHAHVSPSLLRVAIQTQSLLLTAADQRE